MTEQEAIWRTISQAAKELGRSERTIRRWLESGRVEADRTKTPLRVNIADELQTEPGQTPDSDRLQTDVDRLMADNARLEAVLDQVLSERDYLRETLRQSQTLLDQQQRLTTTLTGQKMIEAPGARLSFRQWLGQVLGLPKRDSGDG